MKRKEVTN